MPPTPICTVLDNPPDDFTETDISENLQNEVQIIASSSDSEDDNLFPENGYQLLPQDLEDSLDSNTENGPTHLANLNEDEQPADNHPQVTHPSEEIVALWNEPHCNQNQHQPLDPEQAEKIKAAMVGFTLPPTAVPAWANEIPEEEWKAQLFANIKGRSHSLTSMEKNQDNYPNER